MSYKVEAIESPQKVVLGEAPHWDIKRQSLYYVDILAKQLTIFRYDYVENKTYVAVIGK